MATVGGGALGDLKSYSGGSLGRQRYIPPIIYLAGLTILLFSLSRPEFFLELPRVEGTVILVLDVSNSMSADDYEPTRIEAAKTAARTFVENQPSTVDVGVVAFSNGGLVVQPPTDDQAAILATIDRLSTEGATSLGQGIFSALNAITGEAIPIDPTTLEDGVQAIEIGRYPSAVILMLTDGENTSSPDPFEVAQLAAEAGVRIYPVGIGSPEGSVISIEGFNVLTQLNEGTLQEIASMTNGSYFHAEDEASLNTVYENVDLKMTIGGEKIEITSFIAGLSLLFFLIGGILSLYWFGRMP